MPQIDPISLKMFLQADLANIIVGVVLVLAFVQLNALVLVWLERKVAAHMQLRLGPMEVGPHGLLQTIADGVKLVAKELITPKAVDKPLFWLAPVVIFMPVLVAFVVVPFSKGLIVRDLNIGVILIFAFAALSTLAILMAGWSSNNKYALLGAARSVAQSIAYEIPMLLAVEQNGVPLERRTGGPLLQVMPHTSHPETRARYPEGGAYYVTTLIVGTEPLVLHVGDAPLRAADLDALPAHTVEGKVGFRFRWPSTPSKIHGPLLRDVLARAALPARPGGRVLVKRKPRTDTKEREITTLASSVAMMTPSAMGGNTRQRPDDPCGHVRVKEQCMQNIRRVAP